MIALLNTIPIVMAHLALVEYADGEKSYLLAPNSVSEGDKLIVNK